MKWDVEALRSTSYEVTAETANEAIDKMIDGDATEVGGETISITAQPAEDDDE